LPQHELCNTRIVCHTFNQIVGLIHVRGVGNPRDRIVGVRVKSGKKWCLNGTFTYVPKYGSVGKYVYIYYGGWLQSVQAINAGICVGNFMFCHGKLAGVVRFRIGKTDIVAEIDNGVYHGMYTARRDTRTIARIPFASGRPHGLCRLYIDGRRGAQNKRLHAFVDGVTTMPCNVSYFQCVIEGGGTERVSVTCQRMRYRGGQFKIARSHDLLDRQIDNGV